MMMIMMIMMMISMMLIMIMSMMIMMISVMMIMMMSVMMMMMIMILICDDYVVLQVAEVARTTRFLRPRCLQEGPKESAAEAVAI